MGRKPGAKDKKPRRVNANTSGTDTEIARSSKGRMVLEPVPLRLPVPARRCTLVAMTPVHTDTRRFSFFDPVLLFVAGILVLQGLMGNNGLAVLTGIAVVGFLAFTKHARYDLYADALVIRYWAPRKIIIPLSEIRDVGLVRLPFGGPSVLVHRRGGRVIAIMPKDPESFLAHMKAHLGTTEQRPSPAAPAAAPKPRAPRRRPRR